MLESGRMPNSHIGAWTESIIGRFRRAAPYHELSDTPRTAPLRVPARSGAANKAFALHLRAKIMMRPAEALFRLLMLKQNIKGGENDGLWNL